MISFVILNAVKDLLIPSPVEERVRERLIYRFFAPLRMTGSQNHDRNKNY